MNAPNRFEMFTLADGERLIEVIEDTKIPNAATFKIAKQDHTLAGMIRAQLLSNEAVIFAGYKVPHPLEPYVIIKVQTNGSFTPSQVLLDACNSLIRMITDIKTQFDTKFEMKKSDTDATDEMAGPYGGSRFGGYGEEPTRSNHDYMDM
ncbi:DNA-directed RNA polymerase II subunit RPB11 [Ceratobasidium sp. AG-Ba]|nr:DNA-directed RNA polymerase II subunit RPB11 [Ceratobasidium sp. AG-Ba]QRV90876.1 DNA-directed RNA polymerase II subunit RPB11 [Ceratobasidium sp. AG-Ba]QRW04966.1 DNA-directed RNA polymerase II subunit RPB11 [Ceratobasidium sp. AG-Ba]